MFNKLKEFVVGYYINLYEKCEDIYMHELQAKLIKSNDLIVRNFRKKLEKVLLEDIDNNASTASGFIPYGG